jgi:predicted RNA-binding Zn ribbon-like protein
MTQSQTKVHFDLSGGHLALDFANTVSDRLGSQPRERLNDYRDLVAFGDHSHVYPLRAVDRLYARAGQASDAAKTTLQNALRLREAIFAIFSAVAEGRSAPANALAVLTNAAQDSAAHGRLVSTSRGFQWEWIGMDAYPDSLLWPVARAAVDLLLSDQLGNVRICASDDCAWLFLDTTKNHRRRWCDMKTCGNRMKARRHYERAKAG